MAGTKQTKESEAILADTGQRAGRRTGARPVGAVINAIKILRHLAGARTAQGATEIARATGMYPGTCYQVLRTLTNDDLVQFDETTKAYRSSPGLLTLSEEADATPEGEPKRRRILLSLSGDHGATIYLVGRMRGDSGILVDFVHPEMHRSYPLILSWDSLYVGAMGRLCVALLEPNTRKWRALYDAMPWQQRPEFAEWKADVSAVRQTGYAIDRGNVTPGVTVVATPMCDTMGELSYFLVALYREDPTDDARALVVSRDLRIGAENIRHELALHALSPPPQLRD